MNRAEWDASVQEHWHYYMNDLGIPAQRAAVLAREFVAREYGPRPAADPKPASAAGVSVPGARTSWFTLSGMLKLAGLLFSLRKVATMQFNKGALIQAAIAGVVAGAAALGVANSDGIVSASELLNIGITFFSVAFSALMNPIKPKPQA
jgi:hypothetical protein